MSIFELYPNKLNVIKKYRAELCHNHSLFVDEDKGAGSKNALHKTISQRARIMSVNPVTGRILYLLASMKPDTMIELGTAFGISTMYLASGNPEATVITVEANRQLAEMAQLAFTKYNFGNVNVINDSFDSAIPALAAKLSQNTLVFIDGNHCYEATMRCFRAFFESRILIFDDIRWSSGMKAAWKEIKSMSAERHVWDLWNIGIIIK